MDKNELNEILKRHKLWLKGEGGERANLYGAILNGADLNGADLYRADLHEADLRGADLNGADLNGADLRGADLYRADLHEADLYEADLYEADLRGADLRGADLNGADLYRADLRGADLNGADLYGADLNGADLYGANLYRAKNVPFITMACPEKGAFIGFKKTKAKGITQAEHIVELLILEDARRSSATGRKCRCDKAKVLSITNLDGTKADVDEVRSTHDPDFVYRVGEIVEEPNFCEDRFNECAAGIHFFINRQEAVKY